MKRVRKSSLYVGNRCRCGFEKCRAARLVKQAEMGSDAIAGKAEQKHLYCFGYSKQEARAKYRMSLGPM